MAENYDLSNFSTGVIPSGYGRDIRDLCEMAVAMGWKLAITKDNAMRLLAGDKSNKVIQLNLRKTSHPIEQYRRLVKRYANPLLGTVNTPEAAKARATQVITSMQHRENTQALHAMEKMGATTMVEAGQIAKQIQEEAGNPDDLAAVTVVYEGPMRSRGATRPGGKVEHYYSDVATEVEYGDGRRVFTCTRCSYTKESKTGRSMSAHWQKHVNEDAAAKGIHISGKADTPQVSGYTPHADRLESLKESLREILSDGIDWSDINGAAEALALKALTWDHERKMNYDERDPLTDAQTLDRIRSLVDGGRYAALQEEITALKTEVGEQRVEILTVTEERDKARENLAALRELLNGLGEE